MSLSNIASWFRGTLSFRREMSDLNRLTDRDLKDIGINRYDVSALAKNLKDNPIGR